MKPYAGWWRVNDGNFSICCYKRPRWLTRFLMWHLVEWEWEDLIIPGQERDNG